MFGSQPPPILPSNPKGDKAMHDVNPLGPIMHLRELDRQAAPRLRPFRSAGDGTPMVAASTAPIIAVLRPIHAAVCLGIWPDTQRRLRIGSTIADASAQEMSGDTAKINEPIY